MKTKEQLLVIVNKIKEQGNYDYLLNYTCDNYQEFDAEYLELITDIILETNDLSKIMLMVDKIKTINIEKVVEKVLTLDDNFTSVIYLIKSISYKMNNPQYVNLVTECMNYVLKNADIKSNNVRDSIKTAYEHYKYFLNNIVGIENIDVNVKNSIDIKFQEQEALYAEIEKSFEQARIQKDIDDKNKAIQEFKGRAKKVEFYSSYTDNEHGEFNNLIRFIERNEKLFTEEDKKDIIEIAHNIISISYNYIQAENMNRYGIRGWKIDYGTREELYVENHVKRFLKHYPDSGINFIDIILRCMPKTIIEFKDIKGFPFDEAYKIVKNHDADEENPKRGEMLVKYVVETQDKHQYDIVDLENFVMDYYIIQEYKTKGTPLHTLYHKIKGVNKIRIENFLFDFNVDFAQKKNIRNLALKDLLGYDTVKYSRVQIENEYIKRGIIDDNYKNFIGYNKEGKRYKKWEDFFCEKGTSIDILMFLDSFHYNQGKEKIDIARCLTACINKQDEYVAKSIYHIMNDYNNVDLVALERMLTETGDEEAIRLFISNQKLQNRYFEQLLESERPAALGQLELTVSNDGGQQKKLMFISNNKKHK